MTASRDAHLARSAPHLGPFLLYLPKYAVNTFGSSGYCTCSDFTLLGRRNCLEILESLIRETGDYCFSSLLPYSPTR